MKNKLKIASLFSGCGGLDLGFLGGFNYRQRSFKRLPTEVVFSNDIDSAAVNAYNANKDFFAHNAVQGDIRSIATSDIPNHDILIAGFPCQPFSNAGLRRGISDSRGNLFEECERIIAQKIKFGYAPKAFVFENVKGILSSKMENGVTIPEEIKTRMEALGYTTDYHLIKACDYAAPTDRQRVLFVGIHRAKQKFDFSMLDNTVKKYNLPSAKQNPFDLLLGSILQDIPKDSDGYSAYWAYSPSGQFMVDNIGPCIAGKKYLKYFVNNNSIDKLPKQIFEGRSWKDMNPSLYSPRFRKIYEDPKRYHSPKFYRRFGLGEIVGTMTASAQPENCGITHPFENRRFTIREVARIQSFPDEFKIPYTTIADAYKVLGNAVPPIMSWVIAESLIEYLGA
ncbi:cytosine-specific methyltransferase [Fibrobacterales bacterium]|nr:cytosine-specific methyltransferase [Fibrobacterales bacterium]